MNNTTLTNNNWIGKFMDKIQDRSFVLKIVLIGLVVMFWDLFLNIYNTLIIEPILSKYKAHWSIDLILLCISVLIAFVVIYKITKKEYKILSNSSLFLITAICILYSIVRFSSAGFEYYNLYFLNNFAITDFIIGFASILVIYSFLNIISYNSPPLADIDEVDFLFRDKYALAIADLIKLQKGKKDSFAIGIVGKWGEGKTFLMNLTKRHLAKDNDCVIIDFNPWYSSNPKSLISDFFATLKNNLKKYNPNIGSSFNSYARQLVKFYDKNNALEVVFDSITDSTSTLKEQFDQVKKDIKKIDRQIVICIDDLDRLDKEEIIEVIRLIRNTANFGNTVFLVTYDKAYVNSAIKSLNEYGCDSYLEKIFQQEVVLPAIDSSTLKNKLVKSLSSRIGENSEKWLETVVFDKSDYSPNFDDFFNNYRDVFRFENMFTLPFLQINNDIYNLDFFYLQLLNFKYPTIYQLIKDDLFKTNPDFFSFNYLADSDKVTLLYIFDQTPLVNGLKSNPTIVIKEYLSTTISLSENDLSIIMKLLNHLFPYIPEDFTSEPNFNKFSKINSNYRRLFHKVNYKKYFTFRNLETNMPHLDLISIFTLPQLAINSKIEQCVSEGKHETLDVYFKSIDKFNSKEEYEKIIQSMFYFANQMNPKRDNIIDFNDNITRKWISYTTVKDFYTDETAHRLFILEVFKETEAPALFPSTFIARQLNNWDSKDEVNGEMPFTKEEAINLNMKFLEEYTSELKSFTNEARVLYYYCDLSEPKNLEKANSLIIELANKDLKNFLYLMIIQQPTPRQNVYNLNYYEKLFGTAEKFEKFLAEVKNNEEYYNEFMTFYELAKYHGYSQVKFNFKHLKESKIEEVEKEDNIIIDTKSLQDRIQNTHS